MVFKTTRRMEAQARLIQAKADAELRAATATRLLDDLTRSIGTVKLNQVLGVPELKRLLAYAEASETKAALVRAPHDQDPRVRQARQNALRFLGRRF